MELYTAELSIPSYVSNYRTIMVKLFHENPKDYPQEKLIIPFSEVRRVFHDPNTVGNPSSSQVQAFHSNYSEILYASVKMVDFQRPIWCALNELKRKHEEQNEALSNFMSNSVLSWLSTSSKDGENDISNSDSLLSRLWEKFYLMICIRFRMFGIQEIIDREKEISQLTETLVHLYRKAKKDLCRLNYLTEPFLKHSTLQENRWLMSVMIDMGLIDLLTSAKEIVSYSFENLNKAMDQLTVLPRNFEIPVD